MHAVNLVNVRGRWWISMFWSRIYCL